jgi:hypothetical protein
MADLETLEKAFERFRMVSGQGVDVAGNLSQGFSINPIPDEEGGAVGVGRGACCVGEVCSILTAAECDAAGGTYQGNGTSCVPNPCLPPPPPVGACCVGTACSVTTEAVCIAGGGVYQGNFTDCSPNPCEPVVPPCEGCVAFYGFLGVGNYLRADFTTSWSDRFSGTNCGHHHSSSRTDIWNPETCIRTCSCSGDWTVTNYDETTTFCSAGTPNCVPNIYNPALWPFPYWNPIIDIICEGTCIGVCWNHPPSPSLTDDHYHAELHEDVGGHTIDFVLDVFLSNPCTL